MAGSFKSMFPRNFLDVEDLPNGEITEVEIVCIDLSQFSVRPQQGQRRPGGGRQASAQVQSPEYVMWFREFDKPMRFKRYHAVVLERLMGTDDPEAVKGQRIGIYPGERETYGEYKPAILIHPIRIGQRRPMLAGAEREPEGQPRRRVLDVSDRRPIGKANADKLKQALAEQALTFDSLLRWMKSTAAEAWELATGKALEDLPRCVVPLLQQFLKEAPTAPKEEPVAAADAGIDFKAGLPETRRSAEPVAAAPKPERIEDDDIPF